MKLNELDAFLRSPALRLRTGVWLVSDAWLGKEADLAASLPSRCDFVDLRQVVLQQRGEAARFAQINPDHLRQWVDNLHSADLPCDCAILTQLDLVFSVLSADERSKTWEFFRSAFPRRARALVFAIPQRAVEEIMDAKSLQAWQQNQRLAEE